jgi:hypothetical protein
MWKSLPRIGCLFVLLFAYIGEIGAGDGSVVSHSFDLDGRRFQIELPTAAEICHFRANDNLAVDLVNIISSLGRRCSPFISLRKPLWTCSGKVESFS